MRCEKCCENEATVRVEAAVGDDHMTLNLCAGCAGDMLTEGSGRQPSDVAKVISDIAACALKAGKDASGTPSQDEHGICECCGMSLSLLRQRGRLGCERCLDTFAEELVEWIDDLQKDGTHRGMVPGRRYRSDSDGDINRDLLRIQLERAVSDEAFEKAAALRDRLRALDTSKGV